VTDERTSMAARAAQRYAEVATADGKGDLAELFAEDAEFLTPLGTVVRGREAIRAFYDGHLADYTPTFHIARLLASDDSCWIELAFGEPSAPDLVCANHYTVGADGLITRLVVFLRPRPA
jgi:hypothetical protein